MIKPRKKFNKIKFNERQHKYYVDSNELTSVSRLIGKFKPDFDREEISLKSAEKQGIPQKDILASWEAKKNLSCEAGTALHLYIELYIKYGYEWPGCPNYIRGQIQEFRIFWDKNKHKVDVIDMEIIIYNEEFGVAGTIDLLVRYKKSGHYDIWDWKSNELIRKDNPFQKMIDPLNHLSSSEWIHYSLQIHIYRRMLMEAYPKETFLNGKLIHLPFNEPYQIIKTCDLPEEAYTLLLNA